MTTDTPNATGADNVENAENAGGASVPQSADATTGPANGAAGSAPADAASGASGANAGRSAEVRELERQLDESRTKLRQAEEQARENLDRWQRAQADLSNFRRRTQFEREEQEKYATASLVAALLPVLDSFDRAWQSLPGQLRRLTWLSGVAMIHSQLRGTLERIGLTEIEAEGQPFDPTVHEAVDREEGDGPPHVVAVLQAGYRLHDRVLRPVLVKAGPKPKDSGPASPESPASQPSGVSEGTEGTGAAAEASETPAAGNTGTA
jgi:molecular chaperone GrpE